MLKRDQVYQDLLERISNGLWKPGDKLPSEPFLCRELGVARVTLRAAMRQLADEGFLLRSRPAGTIVTLPQNKRKKIIVLAQVAEDDCTISPGFYISPGIQRRCLELDIDVEYITVPSFPEHLPDDGSYLGVISLLANFNGREELLPRLRNLALPVVCAHAFPGDQSITGLPTIRTDFRAAFAAGLGHLVRMGHSRICFLLRNWNMIKPRMELTPKSMRSLLKENGLDPEKQTMLLLDSNDEDFGGRLQKLLDSSEPPTAVYAYSDHFAIRCCSIVRSRGIRIPEELAVMGFSGYTSAALQNPPLSTVDFGYQRIGRIAVDMIRKSSEWFGKDIPLCFSPYDVITRKSTDCYKLNFTKGAKK